ncbi:olfactory receptor 52K1-like [Lepisosteus oculatus]
MAEYRTVNNSHTEFVFNAFTGLKEHRRLLFIPFFLTLVSSLVGNTLLIFIIKTQRSLHSPMYVLIAAIACVDLSVPIIIVPKMLLGFLFDWNEISLSGCLLQMFFTYFVCSFQSTILLWMSLDRYVAICIPLRYSDYMNNSTIFKLFVAAVLRNGSFVLIIVILASRLNFCLSNVIDHCFCEHMALVNLACGDTTRNSIVGLIAVFCIPSIDVVFIVISYVKIFFVVSKMASGKSRQKAIHTCGTHLIVIGTSYVFTMMPLLAYRIKSSMSTDIRVLLSIMYLLFPSFFNPLIYGIRTKEIKEQILKIFQKSCSIID